MSNDTRNYYERELDQIDFTGEHPAKILIGSEGKVTRTLDVNRESAAAIVSKLCSVFFVDLTLANTMKPAPVERAHHVSSRRAATRTGTRSCVVPAWRGDLQSKPTETCPRRTGTGSRRAPTPKCVSMWPSTATRGAGAFWACSGDFTRHAEERAAGAGGKPSRTARQPESRNRDHRAARFT